MKDIESFYNTDPDKALDLLFQEIEKNPSNEDIVFQLMIIPEYLDNWNKTQKERFYEVLKSALKNVLLTNEKDKWELLKFWELYAQDEEDGLVILDYYFRFIKTYPNRKYAVFYYAEKCIAWQFLPDWDFIELGINKLLNPVDKAEVWVKMMNIQLEVNIKSKLSERWVKILQYSKQAFASDKETAMQLIPVLFDQYTDHSLDEEIKNLYLFLNL